MTSVTVLYDTFDNDGNQRLDAKELLEMLAAINENDAALFKGNYEASVEAAQQLVMSNAAGVQFADFQVSRYY